MMSCSLVTIDGEISTGSCTFDNLALTASILFREYTLPSSINLGRLSLISTPISEGNDCRLISTLKIAPFSAADASAATPTSEA